MERNEKIVAGLGVAGLAASLAIAAMKVKGGQVPPPGTFQGFSLAITNYPEDAAWWMADFPYSGYEGKIPATPVNKGAYIWLPAPGHDTLRISLFTADFLCVSSDPNCAGFSFELDFVDGQHYLLDMSQGILIENPNPPVPPPENKPQLTDINSPSAASGTVFSAVGSLYLPVIYSGKQIYVVVLSTDYPSPPEYRPQVSRIQLGFIRFMSLEMIDYVKSIDPGALDPWQVEGPLVPLTSPDDSYDFSKNFEMKTLYYDPGHGGYFWYVIPPGSYPLNMEIISAKAVYVPGPTGGLGSVSQVSHDLGPVSVIEVL